MMLGHKGIQSNDFSSVASSRSKVPLSLVKCHLLDGLAQNILKTFRHLF